MDAGRRGISGFAGPYASACACACALVCVFFSLDVGEQRQRDVLRVSRLPLGGVMTNA